MNNMNIEYNIDKMNIIYIIIINIIIIFNNNMYKLY